MPGNDDLLAGIGYGPAAAASGALDTFAPLDPDQEAKNRQTARAIGLPPSVVRSAPDLAQTQARRQGYASPDVKAALQAAPNAARWLARGDNAAVAHDDVPVLSTFGLFLKGVTHVMQPGYFTGALHGLSPDNIWKSVKASIAQGAESVAGVAERDFAMEDDISPLAWAQRKIFGQSVNGGLAELARRRAATWQQVSEKLTPKVKSGFARDLLSGVQAIPGSLAAAGVTLFTDNPFAGAAVIGDIAGGQGYAEARRCST